MKALTLFSVFTFILASVAPVFAQDNNEVLRQLIAEKEQALAARKQAVREQIKEINAVREDLENAASGKSRSYWIGVPSGIVGVLGIYVSGVAAGMSGGATLETKRGRVALLASAAMIVGGVVYILVKRHKYSAVDEALSEAMSALVELVERLDQEDAELQALKARLPAER